MLRIAIVIHADEFKIGHDFPCTDEKRGWKQPGSSWDRKRTSADFFNERNYSAYLTFVS
jgi:hypothetical protein